MPFERGNFAVTMFRLTKDLPDNYIELLNENSAGKLEDVKDEVQIGWTGNNHLLETSITEENTQLGGFIFFQMRVAKKKVSPSQLKADIKLEEMAHIKATGRPDLSKKIKRQIKEDVTERLLRDATPQFSGTQVVIDQNDNTIYLGTTSTSAIDYFIELFVDTFNTAPIQIVPEELMTKAKIKSTDYRGIELPNSEDDEFTPGRDFLTWLWYYSEKHGGEVEVNDYGKFAVMIEGPLTFTAEGKGAIESVVKKGNTTSSVEAKASLTNGKKLKKAKINFVKDEENWITTFDSDNFMFTGLKLPEGEEMDYASRFAERINNLHLFKEAKYTFYNKFMEQVKEPEALNQNIAKWIEERISL